MVKQTIKTVYNVWQKSDAENPIKTGIMPVDFVIGKTRYGRAGTLVLTSEKRLS